MCERCVTQGWVGRCPWAMPDYSKATEAGRKLHEAYTIFMEKQTMATMRAKFQINKVELFAGGQERLEMAAVAKSGAYPEDGSDEDNTYAKFSPSGSLTLTIANPALAGKFKPGQKFYLDFTEAL
jgi:hypothetical protein